MLSMSAAFRKGTGFMLDLKPLFSNLRVRSLLFALAIILPFEVLSLLGTHFPAWLEWPLFGGIIVLFGRGVLLHGLRSLLRFDVSDINLLMTISALSCTHATGLKEQDGSASHFRNGIIADGSQQVVTSGLHMHDRRYSWQLLTSRS
jgi:hypothetical protein